jgi:ferritin heavy chain
MSGTEKVLEGIKHFADTNLDKVVKTTSFKEELEEASHCFTSSH